MKLTRSDEAIITAQSPEEKSSNDDINRHGKTFSHGRRDVLKGVAALATLPLLPQLSAEAFSGRETPAAKALAGNERERSFDDGWRFFLGEADGAERADFDDRHWRLLDLPHDW